MITHLCQQYELYAAEAGLPRGREFASPAELQSFVDGLRDQPWWERFYPQVLRVEAVFTRSTKGSVGGWQKDMGAGRIEMHAAHRCELIVCHELAHVLANARYSASCGHSPWFARTYIELVFFIMGHEVANQLLEAFRVNGIECDPAREDFEWGRCRFELGAAS